jgi:hypothetical protein
VMINYFTTSVFFLLAVSCVFCGFSTLKKRVK